MSKCPKMPRKAGHGLEIGNWKLEILRDLSSLCHIRPCPQRYLASFLFAKRQSSRTKSDGNKNFPLGNADGAPGYFT